MRFLRNILILLAILFIAPTSRGQQTLFTYATAPDTCSTLESRCNYLVQHFWDNCNLSKPFPESNDSLLVEAMIAYIDVMRAGANVNITTAGIRDLMFKAQSNQSNFIKLMSVAEFLLYMRPTPIIDDVYLAFAQSAANASWAKKDFKEHYRDQVTRITNTKLGDRIADLELVLTDGSKASLRSLLTADVNFLFITDYSTDNAFERTRLYTDINMKQAIADGTVKVINIMAGDPPKTWDEKSLDYSTAWTVGSGKTVMSMLDIRILPCIIILDKDGSVQVKNINVDGVKKLFE